jgi:hypothetical protein
MAIAFQGFAIKNNLGEAESDRAILNNLGGSPIGDDIALLYNNNRNLSSVTVTADNISGELITIPDAQAIYSNRTPIKVGSLTYYIKGSNGQDSFKLSSSPDLSDTVIDPPEGDYVRSDAVTFDNIRNYSIVRRSSDVNRTDSDTQLGFVTSSSRAVFLGNSTVRQTFESLEKNIDFYNFRKSKSLNINSNFLGSKRLETSGVNIITDVDNVNSASLTNSSPGLFIYNAETNSGIRAFSSSDNPWRYDPIGDPNNLIVQTSSVNIGELKFNSNNIELISKNLSEPIVETVTSQTVISNFTHKVPISVNGETYFLCLKIEG